MLVIWDGRKLNIIHLTFFSFIAGNNKYCVQMSKHSITYFSYSFFFFNNVLVREDLPQNRAVGSGCRIRWQHLLVQSAYWNKTHLQNEWPGYDMTPSDDKTWFLKLWWMWNISSLPLLPGPLWSGAVIPFRVLSQIELFNLFLCQKSNKCKQTNDLY